MTVFIILIFLIDNDGKLEDVQKKPNFYYSEKECAIERNEASIEFAKFYSGDYFITCEKLEY